MKTEEEIRQAAGHPDAIPRELINWFVKGALWMQNTIVENEPKKYAQYPFNADSSNGKIYSDAVALKDKAKNILKKHLDETGICLTSRFARQALRAMMEFKKENL